MADDRSKRSKSRFSVKRVLQLLAESDSEPDHSSDKDYEASSQESTEGKHDDRNRPRITIIRQAVCSVVTVGEPSPNFLYVIVSFIGLQYEINLEKQ